MPYYVHNGRPGLYVEVATMSEIPMYPNELDCPCGIGEHDNPWQCAAYLRERLKAVENARDNYQQLWDQLCEMVAAMCMAAGADEEAIPDAWTLAEVVGKLRKVADAARAYVDSDDEDRAIEFDALEDALALVKP